MHSQTKGSQGRGRDQQEGWGKECGESLRDTNGRKENGFRYGDILTRRGRNTHVMILISAKQQIINLPDVF